MDADPMDTVRTEAEGTVDADDADDADDAGATATVVDADSAADPVEEDTSATDETDVEPLTITLPDGSESVSEAILSHRRMLTNPSEHGLVSAEEADDILGAVEALSAEVSEDLDEELTTLERSVEGMVDRLDRQEARIEELQETVESLAEILGASVEFEDGEA
jgi:hypothetical protein